MGSNGVTVGSGRPLQMLLSDSSKDRLAMENHGVTQLSALECAPQSTHPPTWRDTAISVSMSERMIEFSVPDLPKSRSASLPGYMEVPDPQSYSKSHDQRLRIYMNPDIPDLSSLDIGETPQPILNTERDLENWASKSSARSLSLGSYHGERESPDNQIQFPQEITSIDLPILVRKASQILTPTPLNRERLQILRQRVLVLRAQAQDQRRVVQTLVAEVSAADEEYMKMIRTSHVMLDPLIIDQAAFTKLEGLRMNCQRARDELGLVEDVLSSMEARLDSQEMKLTAAEEEFYGEQDTGNIVNVEDLSSGSSSDRTSWRLEHREFSLYETYQIRLGEEDILREKWDGIMDEKRYLKTERERRHRAGLELDADDQRFLDHFATIVEPTRRELEEAERDVKRLKEMCISEGLINETEDKSPHRDDVSQAELSWVGEDRLDQFSDTTVNPSIIEETNTACVRKSE